MCSRGEVRSMRPQRDVPNWCIAGWSSRLDERPGTRLRGPVLVIERELGLQRRRIECDRYVFPIAFVPSIGNCPQQLRRDVVVVVPEPILEPDVVCLLLLEAN